MLPGAPGGPRSDAINFQSPESSAARAGGGMESTLLILPLSSAGEGLPPGDLGEDRIEPVGCFVLHPMPCSRDHLKPGIRLSLAQSGGALIQIGIGRRVALAPNPVETRLDQRQRPGKRVRPREPAALDPAARRVLRLDVDRQLVDFAGSAIISAPRLWRATARISASEAPSGTRSSAVGCRTRPRPFEPTIVNPLTWSPSCATTWPPSTPPNENPAICKSAALRKNDVEAFGDDPSQALRRMRLGRSADSPSPANRERRR